MARGRRDIDDALLVALACGATVESAAGTVGIGAATVYRRLKDERFRLRLKEIRADMMQRTSAMLTAAGDEGVKTLLTLMKDASPPAVRLGAARAVLDIGLRFRETAELEGRIAALEAHLTSP